MPRSGQLMPTAGLTTDNRQLTTALRSRDDGRLDVAVAIEHVPQYLLQARQRRFAGDVVGPLDLVLADQGERFAHRLRRVMERGLQRQLVIVQALRIQRDRGPAGATAEEVDGAAFAHHVDGPLPGLRAAYRLDDHVATACLRE